MKVNQIHNDILIGHNYLDIIGEKYIYLNLPRIKCRAIVLKDTKEIICCEYVGVDSGAIKKDLDSFTSFHKNKWVNPIKKVLQSYDINYLVNKLKYLSQFINKKTLKIREEIKEKELNKRGRYV